MGDSNSKHISFSVFYFNMSNKISKISSTPPCLLNFQEFSNLFTYSKSLFIKFPTPLPSRLLQAPFYLAPKNNSLFWLDISAS